MTNDLSTLNGSLVEMKDQLIYELGQKGVSASYDSTTGLLGLIGKISEIQQGSCYHIEFGEASYTAVGGSATLTVYLQENYAPKSGASVTVTGSDGSVYNGITNTNGLASITVSVSSDTTFTCTYNNVSDTCTVTVQSYLYQSDMTTDDGNWTKSSSSGMSITYSTNGCTVKGTTSSDRTYNLSSSITLPTNFVVEYDITAYALGAYNNSTEFVVHNSRIIFENTKLCIRPMNNNDNITTMDSPATPIQIKVEVNNGTISTYVNGSLFGTSSVMSSYKNIGFKTYNNRSITVKNLRISAL